jgi:hypothetical protein
MRRTALIPGNPWTLLITVQDDPDSLGCVVRIQELTMDGTTSDFRELHYARVADALRELEMSYGIGADDWLELD